MHGRGESPSDADLFALGDDEMALRVLTLVAEHNRVAAELTRAVRVADARQLPERDGLKSMTSWLIGHARVSPPAASRLVRNGRALAQLPAVEAGFSAGDVSAEQVATAARVVMPERVAQAADLGVDLGAVDRVLAGVAAAEPFAKLAAVVEHYLARLDPDGPEPDPTEKRSLRMTKHADGSVSGWFDVDAVGGEKVQAALEAIVAAGRSAGDERTRGQQQADALVQLCDLQLAAGDLPLLRTRKPHIGAVIPLSDLVDPSAGRATAEMGFGATISAARARWIACDGGVVRIVMGSRGVPIDRGREVRITPAPLRQLVDLRDGGCVFAGCTAPPWWCEAHHLLDWAFGGETELENLALLCERHHGKVHHGYRVERQPDGTYRTWRPDGTEILIGPALLAAA